MTANVITYRARMAVREMGKVLGMAEDAISRLSKLLASFSFREDLDQLPATLREGGQAGLWRGATYRFVSNAPSGAIMFAVYEGGYRWIERRFFGIDSDKMRV